MSECTTERGTHKYNYRLTLHFTEHAHNAHKS